MLDFASVRLENMIVHKVGNKLNEEELRLSDEELAFDDAVLKEMLMKYFLQAFKDDAFYNFTHPTDLPLNPVFNYAEKIFDSRGNFVEQSVHMAQLLYEKSEHPKIKGGELYVVYFADCVLDDEVTDAIGIFKSENKDRFIKIYQRQGRFEVGYDEGVNINRLDKGCLIFNTDRHLGYKICITDNTNKSGEAQYWKDSFLQLKAHSDDYYRTQTYMKLCKDFVKEVLQEEQQMPKNEQIEVLSKSVQYFQEKEKFDKEEFAREVLQEPAVIDAFEEYKQKAVVERQIPDLSDDFDISDKAVKQTKKQFKSVLKLDKNFSVYVHGNRELMERGFDQDKQMSYYRFYFSKED